MAIRGSGGRRGKRQGWWQGIRRNPREWFRSEKLQLHSSLFRPPLPGRCGRRCRGPAVSASRNPGSTGHHGLILTSIFRRLTFQGSGGGASWLPAASRPRPRFPCTARVRFAPRQSGRGAMAMGRVGRTRAGNLFPVPDGDGASRAFAPGAGRRRERSLLKPHRRGTIRRSFGGSACSTTRLVVPRCNRWFVPHC